jgi:diketogulonate reductase-like aldo/keto reductase
MDEVEDCEAACKRSLERLGLEYLDLYLVHWPLAVRDISEEDGVKKYERINIPMYKIWAQMEALVDKGLVRNIGVSNFNVQLLWDMISYARIKPTHNEVELHPLNTQEKLVKFMKD